MLLRVCLYADDRDLQKRSQFPFAIGVISYVLPSPSFLGRLGLDPLEIEAGELIHKAIDNYFVRLSHPGMGSINLDSCSYTKRRH